MRRGVNSTYAGRCPQGNAPTRRGEKVRLRVKQRMFCNLRRCRQAGLRLSYLIIVNHVCSRGAYDTADTLSVHNTTVYRVAQRSPEQGEWGPLGGRTTAPPRSTSVT
jgi:hypothetical protein